jgi:hypothetical protein
MNATTHYENANFSRELSESLPSIRPQGHSQAQAELLQRLADEVLAQARHDEWVRAKLSAARAGSRPSLTNDEVMARLGALRIP